MIGDTILIVGRGAETDEWRGGGAGGGEVVSVAVDLLAEQAGQFSRSISAVLKNLEAGLEGLSLDKVEVNVGISLNGKFALLGFGVDAQGQAGIKLSFSRPSSKADE